MPEKDATPTSTSPKGDDAGQIGQIVQLVKDYARQETIGPLKGAGRWLAFGTAGALAIGVGCAFLVLGVLRLMQTEFPGTFGGNWTSLWPYAIAFGVAVVVIVIAATRIGKKTLQKERS